MSGLLLSSFFRLSFSPSSSLFFSFLPRNTWHTTCYLSLLWKNNNLTWTSCVYFLIYPSSQHSFMYLSIHWYLLCPPMKLSYWMLEMHIPTVEVRPSLLGDYVTCPGYRKIFIKTFPLYCFHMPSFSSKAQLHWNNCLCVLSISNWEMRIEPINKC